MTRVRIALVFAAGCLTTAVGNWAIASLRAQGPPAANVVHACAAADGVLHVIGAFANCPAGQTSLFFRSSGAPAAAAAPSDTASDADARIRSLQQRLAALEAEARRNSLTRRVVAPFEVMDHNGKVVFAVETSSVNLYNSSGRATARLVTVPDGGVFIGQNNAGTLVTSAGVGGGQIGIDVLENQTVRADMGKSLDDGNYRLKFLSKGGQTLAGIGESLDNPGTGLVVIGDTAGNTRALMGVDKDLGQFLVANGKRTPVAILTEGKTNGGLFTLMSSSGERMVAAGVQPGGFGVVQTGPASFMQAAGLGLPGSYIAGKPK